MATSKDLERMFGISHRTINTWQKGRDDRFLLTKFLMSYSPFEIEDRLTKILDQEGLVKKAKQDFIHDLAKDPVKAGISKSTCVKVINDSQSKDESFVPDLLLELEDGTLQVVEFISVLPSSTHLKTKIEKLMTYAKEYSINVEKIEIIFITKSPQPSFLTTVDDDNENSEELKNLYSKVKIIDIDKVTTELYEKPAIVI